jgi:hypothetical protein
LPQADYINSDGEDYGLIETAEYPEENAAIDQMGEFEVGKLYRVTFGDQTYECVAEMVFTGTEDSPEYSIGVGNPVLARYGNTFAELNGAVDNGLPFFAEYFYYEDDDAWYGLITVRDKTSTTINIGISRVDEIIHKLPEKFLPDSLLALPAVTDADNGKVLMVVNGQWQLVTLNLTVDENGVASV